MIFTSTDGRSRLDTWAGTAEVEVVGVDQPSAEEALAYLLEEWGAETVSIEAGPITALPLYRPGSAPLIDELLLSVYLGDRVAGSVRGAPFLDPTALGRAFWVGHSPTTRNRAWSASPVVPGSSNGSPAGNLRERQARGRPR
jgi:hypothetical protein